MPGMVVCPEPLAAEAGAEILRRGGNAMEAAVAAAFAQGVCDPLMCGIGGVGVLTAVRAASGESLCVRFHGIVGSHGHPEIFARDALGSREGETPQVRGDRNCMGYESIAVPGFARGVLEGLRHFGSSGLSTADVVAPSIRLAT